MKFKWDLGFGIGIGIGIGWDWDLGFGIGVGFGTWVGLGFGIWGGMGFDGMGYGRQVYAGYFLQVCLRFFYASSSALVRTESASLQVRLYVSRPGRNHQIVDRVLYVGGLTRESM